MEKIKREIKRLEEVKRCFVKTKDGFRLHDLEMNLSSVLKKYEDILIKNGIGFYYLNVERGNKHDIYCVYYDKTCFETIDEKLPTYEFKKGKYYYIGDYTSKVPSKETVEAAQKIKILVEAEMKKERDAKRIRAIKDAIGNKNAVYTQNGVFAGSPDEGRFENYYLFVNVREDGTKSQDIIIFDLDKVYKENVSLEVPENLIERVLGKNQEYAKRWIDTLGLSQMEVEPV